jgi:hypothetical protein
MLPKPDFELLDREIDELERAFAGVGTDADKLAQCEARRRELLDQIAQDTQRFERRQEQILQRKRRSFASTAAAAVA